MDRKNSKSDVKISVVVPIYNAGRYLQICLNSIINQTYQNFEAILVDDGSTDDSGIICDRFAGQDERLHVIHKKNAGLICARKTGIQEAGGEYIAFVDADDWIDEDFLETGVLQMKYKKADIIIAGCIRENGISSETVQNKICSGEYNVQELVTEVYPRMLHYEAFYEFGILPYIWNKFYKKQLLESCYADIDTRIYDGEDAAVVYPYLLKARKAVITEETKYHYRIHRESMTANRGEDYFENTARLYLYLAAKFQQAAYGRCMMPQLDNYMRMMIWQANPGGFIESTKFIFPFKRVPKGVSIILYGAGYVGQTFHHQLLLSEYCTIAAWVDRSWQREELRRMGVTGIETLYTQIYDYIVLAVSDKEIADEIKKQLISNGTNEEKIIFGVQ